MPVHPAPFVIHANLDCEARWAGGSLPGGIATRVSHYAALLAALAPVDAPAVEVWAPAAIDGGRLARVPGLPHPEMRTGTPPAPTLAWASPEARAVNDRRLALALAAQLGCALPGARVIHAIDEVAPAARAALGPRWVTKSPWTTAGRDRCHGEGAPTVEQATRLGRLLARAGALVFEPWVERVLDVGVCASIVDGQVHARAPHGLVTDARGTFLGIDLRPPALTATEVARLEATVHAVGAALHARGHAGPFAIDAFVYSAGDERRLHPLCEINARHTFGWVAHALGTRLGVTRLGFGTPPPGARVLITPADDGITAWVA